MAVDIRKVEQDRSIILFDAGLVKESVGDFWTRAEQARQQTPIERGRACFFEAQGLSCNCRHYRRGGLVEALLQDRYFGTGLRGNRAFNEFRLLCELRQQGLPVPVPVAARVEPGLCFYRADLATLRIPGARSLAEILRSGSLNTEQWQKVGALIARFHRAGLWHVDLNAGNILCDAEGRWYLIDFDRCRLRKPGSWSRRNLRRLQRSLNKLKRLATGDFFFADGDWQQLMAGYAGHIEEATNEQCR